MNISTCPYLGLQADPETQVSFPSQSNFCHHLKTPGPVGLEYQRTFCQSALHARCLVFPQGRHTRLPIEAQVIAAERKIIRRPWVMAVALVLILGWITFSLAPDLLPFSFQLFPQTQKTLPAPPITAPPSVTLPSLTVSPDSVTPTARTPVASSPSGMVGSEVALATATYAPLGLETPIGTDPMLLIHRVLPGENLDLIAARFDTSVEAIQAINYFLPSPLWADLPLVVPLGKIQTAGLPQFEAYQVSAAGVTVEQFAQSLDVNAMQLCKYNLLPEGATLIAGQWLLVPRPSK